MKNIKYITISIITIGVILGAAYFAIEKLNFVLKPANTSELFKSIYSSDIFSKAYAAPERGNRDMAQLIARAIYGEARGEIFTGQVAVGAVILNRVEDPRFPKSIPGVIYQPGAFTAVSDGQINLPVKQGDPVYKAARDALNGWDPTGGCVYYFNPATATSKWIWSKKIVTTIGKHKFAK